MKYSKQRGRGCGAAVSLAVSVASIINYQLSNIKYHVFVFIKENESVSSQVEKVTQPISAMFNCPSGAPLQSRWRDSFIPVHVADRLVSGVELIYSSSSYAACRRSVISLIKTKILQAKRCVCVCVNEVKSVVQSRIIKKSAWMP